MYLNKHMYLSKCIIQYQSLYTKSTSKLSYILKNILIPLCYEIWFTSFLVKKSQSAPPLFRIFRNSFLGLNYWREKKSKLRWNFTSYLTKPIESPDTILISLGVYQISSSNKINFSTNFHFKWFANGFSRQLLNQN